MLIPVNQAFESLNDEQLVLLRALSNQAVEFTIVGGYAMRCLGHLRSTFDLDIVINQSSENVARTRRSLEALASNNTSSLEEVLLQPEKKITWHSVEIFTTMRGFTYAEIERESLLQQVQDMQVRTMSLNHMKRAKELALCAPDRRGKEELDEADLMFLRTKSAA